jgi:hypothetical protein
VWDRARAQSVGSDHADPGVAQAYIRHRLTSKGIWRRVKLSAAATDFLRAPRALKRHGSLSPGRWHWMGSSSTRVSTTLLTDPSSALPVSSCASLPGSPSHATPAVLLQPLSGSPRPVVSLGCSSSQQLVARRAPHSPAPRFRCSWRRRDMATRCSLPPQAKAYVDSANPAMETSTVLLIALWYICNIGVLLLNKYLLSFYGFRYRISPQHTHATACRSRS